MIKNINKDDGNSSVILGIMLIVTTLMIGAMMLDITKAFQMKSAYNDAAQKATQAAIRYQNTEGYLTAESVAEAVLVYENVTRLASIKDGYMSSCEKPRKVKITIKAMRNNFVVGQEFTIYSNKVSSSDTVETILNKISNLNSKAKRDTFEKGKYLGIEMELTESTPNVILPNTSTIAGLNEEGVSVKCQEIGVRAGASQYIGKEGVYD